MENEKLKKYCLDNLNFEDLGSWPPPEYCYPCLSLCAIDAVFSINTNYEAVRNVIKRIKNLPFLEPLHEFKQWLEMTLIEKMEMEYFNSQKVGATKRSKIEILKDFISVLLKHGFNNKKNFNKFVDNVEIDSDLKKIIGIGDTTISYFFMLAGDKNSIKPDRHVKRFISDGSGILTKKITNELALDKLKSVLPEIKREMQKRYPSLSSRLTLRSLDYLIWSFQKNIKKTN